MYCILYFNKSSLKRHKWFMHVETTEDFGEAEKLQEEVGQHFKSPAMIIEVPTPAIPIQLVKG